MLLAEGLGWRRVGEGGRGRKEEWTSLVWFLVWSWKGSRLGFGLWGRSLSSVLGTGVGRRGRLWSVLDKGREKRMSKGRPRGCGYVLLYYLSVRYTYSSLRALAHRRAVV